MRDSVLHLVTNRASTFGSPIFPSASLYVPHTEGTSESSLRDFLRLRSNDPAYYLVGVLASVYSFPEIVEEFKETDKTFDLKDYVPPSNTVSGGSFVNLFGKSFSLERVPIEYPILTDILVKYKDSREVSIVACNNTYNVPFAVRSGDNLDIEWPEELGIHGILYPSAGTWITGSYVNIYHQPITYPYKVVTDSVLKNSDYIQLLSSLGLMKNIYSAQSPVERMALIALALANPSTYA